MNTRLIAARVLARVLKNDETLTASLDKTLTPAIPAQDRAFIKAVAYGVCRHYHRLDFILNSLIEKPVKALEVKALILIGLYQLIYMRVKNHAAVSETVRAAKHLAWAKNLINAVLRAFLRQSESIQQQAEADKIARYSHPEWLIRRIEADWPGQAGEILLENNLPPPMVLRVNQRKTTRTDYLELLCQKEMAAQALAYCPLGIILEKPVPVEMLPGFADGLVSVQDGAAQLAAPLLNAKPGHRVLDVCAAPGGKTAHLLELQPELRELVAVDIDAGRLKRVKDTLGRLQLAATLIQGDAAMPGSWWDGKQFDRILLDAPCSATGVIRRHPDIKILRREEDVAAIALLQKKNLSSVWSLLAPGGELLYVTCSILKQENEEQMIEFLSRNEDAEERPVEVESSGWGLSCLHGRQILTGDASMDGFYYARITKNLAINWLILLFALLPARKLFANDYGITVKQAEAFISGDQYVVSADVDFRLSDRAVEALKNGVPLFWTYQFKVHEQRSLLWDKAVVEKNIRYRIQYHALLNVYRVRNENSGTVSNSYTLEDALEHLSSLREIPLLEKKKVSQEEDYLAGLKVTFDRDALPLPLRPVAYVNPQWYLSSDWFTWTLIK